MAGRRRPVLLLPQGSPVRRAGRHRLVLRPQGPAAQATAHRYLGAAFIRLRRYPDAQAQLALALELYQSLGDQLGQARSHLQLALISWQQGDLGDAYHAARNLCGARDSWEQALAIFEYLHHVRAHQVRRKLRVIRPQPGHSIT
jgi:tetratricopeptide (TPR) repeat protein